MLVNQKEVSRLLSKYNIKTPKTIILSSEIKNITFPVVLKVDSGEVIHKSDVGLVFTNIKNKEELFRHKKTAETILRMHRVKKYELIVQEQVKGQEIIVGMKRDNTFGPVILFGLGGILVEVLKDVSMRIAPLSKKDCIKMIEEIKGKKLLEGFRNIKPVKKQALVELLMKLSKLSINEKYIQEIDFNPVMIDGDNVIVVDARLIKDV